jgi:hypothetical protein
VVPLQNLNSQPHERKGRKLADMAREVENRKRKLPDDPEEKNSEQTSKKSKH